MEEIQKAIQERRLNLEDNLDSFSKGQILPVGTIRKRPNGDFIKTAMGWKYHGKNAKSVAVGTQAKEASNAGGDHKKLDKSETTTRQRLNQINKELGYGSVLKDSQMTQEQSTVYMAYTKTYGNHPRVDIAKEREYNEHLQNTRNDFANRGHKDAAARVQKDIDKQLGPWSGTIREVLADKEGKKLVEAAEEYQSDLRDDPTRKEHLDGLKNVVKQLQEKFGYSHDISAELANAKKDTGYELEWPSRKAFSDRSKLGRMPELDKLNSSQWNDVVKELAEDFHIRGIKNSRQISGVEFNHPKVKKYPLTSQGVRDVDDKFRSSYDKLIKDTLKELSSMRKESKTTHIGDMNLSQKQKHAQKLGIDVKGKSEAQLNKLMISANINKQISEFSSKRELTQEDKDVAKDLEVEKNSPDRKIRVGEGFTSHETVHPEYPSSRSPYKTNVKYKVTKVNDDNTVTIQNHATLKKTTISIKEFKKREK
jgi:hypothetical protein